MRIGEATNRDDLISALNAAVQRRLEVRRGYETIWWNNIALVAGDHYSTWNPMLNQFEDRDLLWEQQNLKKPRMVVNHALTVARTELAKLTKSHPIMEVIANSDESTDIAATKVGKSALDFAEWRFRLRKKRKQALWWMIQTGVGAIYVGYDQYDEQQGSYEFVIDPDSGDPVFDPTRLKQLRDLVDEGQIDPLEVKKYPLGDLCYQVFSPFQLLPDETATEFDEIKDLITVEITDVDMLKGQYGSKANNITPDANAMLGTMEARMWARAGVPGGIGSLQQKTETGAKVYTFWLLPNVYKGNKYLKDGICIRWTANSTVLEESNTFPYADGRMPFAFFTHIPTSTTIWPDCVMNHIRGPNLEIDKTVSQLIESKDYMANPMWLIASQHKLKGEVRNVAGAMIRYRHVPNIPPPQPVQGMQMPQQVENLLVGLRQQILDISGQSEVARGGVPSGVRSGVAVAYLQEEDDTKIAPTVENMEEAIAYMGSLTLTRFAQFYYLDRIIRFYRRDGAFDARKFKGADLKNNTDVICQAGSAMPKSKSSRQQFELELVSLGIEKDPNRIRDVLELGNAEEDDMSKTIAQANRENNMMLYGVWAGTTTQDVTDETFKKVATAVPVKAWQNHQVHIQRHTSVMMDEEFDDLMITRPEVVRLFDEHIAMHQQQLAAQQQQQAQMLMAAKGAPDGPPGQASQPGPDASGNGFGRSPSENISSTDVPDVIGSGLLRTRTRQVRPQ